jgi:MscS family membrane protein
MMGISNYILENKALFSLALFLLGLVFLYLILFYVLKSIFRRLETDIALVSLIVSSYPILIVYLILGIKFNLHHQWKSFSLPIQLFAILNVSLIVIITYWLVQIFNKVIIYYLKSYTKESEAMWDDVLLPIVEAVIPVIIYILGGAFALKFLGVDLTGIWVTLGGATFVIGFAVKDILSNFFSGIVLLIDTPFRFGDVLSLEDGTIGTLKKIGIRVTQLYISSTHSDIYIPNSVLQGQKIVNLSRPTPYYQSCVTIEVPTSCDFEQLRHVAYEIVMAHPNTLGDIDQKVELIDKYYQEPELQEQQEIGQKQLLAEHRVDEKLEEISLCLDALVATIQFAEKGGLTSDEIANVQQEYQGVLELVGTEEQQQEDSLIELVKQWYRDLIRDPNLLDEDAYIISQEWERKINLLKSRISKLYQKIANPKGDETRLDDYVMEINQWLKEKFKQPRLKWQDPQIRITAINHDEDSVLYVELTINFFIKNFKLENGKRISRINSQIYDEIIEQLKNNYLV